MRPRPSRSHVALAALAIALACSLDGDEVVYARAHDDRAMAALASRYTDASGTLDVELCEDVPRSDAWEGPGCSVQHVVRGDGRGLAHSEEVGGVGCGGCLFRVEAWVTARVPDGAGGTRAMAGEVSLQSGRDDDPYAFPWDVTLRDETGTPLALGVLRADGTFSLSVDGIELELRRAGAATCPAPIAP